MANKLGAMSKLDAVPPVMARGEPATFYGDGNMPCAVALTSFVQGGFGKGLSLWHGCWPACPGDTLPAGLQTQSRHLTLARTCLS